MRVRGPQGAELPVELLTVTDIVGGALHVEGTLDGAGLTIEVTGVDADASTIHAVSESGLEYTLRLGEREATITIDYGHTAQTITVFDSLGLAHLEAITDARDAREVAADGPLRHSASHAAVLGVVDHLSQQDRRFDALRGRLAAITAAAVELGDDGSVPAADGSGLATAMEPSAAPAEAEPSQAEAGGEDGGADEGGGDDNGDDKDATQKPERECKPEVERPWKAGDQLALTMGPVVVEASLVQVEGTSICDNLEGVIEAKTSGSVAKSFGPAGPGQCRDGYESVYRLSGNKSADAQHVRCCWPNGKVDDAVAGSLKLAIGNYSLTVEGAGAHSDMSSKAHAKITADIMVCVDEDLSDEGYGVSETWTAEASIL